MTETRTYSTDVLLEKFNVPKTYSMDILLEKYDIPKTYDVDVLLKNIWIIKHYDIDVLTKKLDIISEYGIDVKISSIPASTTLIGGDTSLEFTPIEWREYQDCEVAIQDLPLALAQVINDGIYVIKTKRIDCKFRCSDSEKSTLETIFDDTGIVSLYLRASGSNNYWHYNLWLRDYDIVYEYRNESDAERPWFVNLIFDVEAYSYRTV